MFSKLVIVSKSFPNFSNIIIDVYACEESEIIAAAMFGPVYNCLMMRVSDIEG